MRVPNLRKWFIRSFMLLLVLVAYGGTAVGNRNLIKVAEATESESGTFVFHEINATRRESSNPKRHRERRHGEADEHQSQPDFRRHGRLWFVDERFQLHEAFGPPPPSRAPPAIF
ncbi:MAG: hypothetical protein L0387_13120 [Acidobacteria bacterium]|nr:hypothetical protein [Acidobacteriota bacterium]MCI0721875.1 hypothetical protein [Acidobacteriota bacterium]